MAYSPLDEGAIAPLAQFFISCLTVACSGSAAASTSSLQYPSKSSSASASSSSESSSSSELPSNSEDAPSPSDEDVVSDSASPSPSTATWLLDDFSLTFSRTTVDSVCVLIDCCLVLPEMPSAFGAIAPSSLLAAERGAGAAAAFFLGSTMNSSSSLSLPLPLLPEDITTLDLLSASLFAGLGAGFFLLLLPVLLLRPAAPEAFIAQQQRE